MMCAVCIHSNAHPSGGWAGFICIVRLDTLSECIHAIQNMARDVSSLETADLQR